MCISTNLYALFIRVWIMVCIITIQPTTPIPFRLRTIHSIIMGSYPPPPSSPLLHDIYPATHSQTPSPLSPSPSAAAPPAHFQIRCEKDYAKPYIIYGSTLGVIKGPCGPWFILRSGGASGPGPHRSIYKYISSKWSPFVLRQARAQQLKHRAEQCSENTWRYSYLWKNLTNEISLIGRVWYHGRQFLNGKYHLIKKE